MHAVEARGVQPLLGAVRWHQLVVAEAPPPLAAADAPGAAHGTLPLLVAPSETVAALGSIAAAGILNLIKENVSSLYEINV